jgi:hypothetical protein
MERTGLSEFKDVLTDFRQLGSLALKGVVAAPWVDLWLKIGPPPATSIAVLTSLSEFVVVVWVFHFWSDLEVRKLNARMKVAFVVFCIGLVASLMLISRFTVSPGEGRERVIEGWTLRPDLQPLMNPSYSPEQALRDSEYDPDKVWTSTSVTLVRALITTVWFGTFASLACYLTAFIMLQRRRSSAPLVQTANSR